MAALPPIDDSNTYATKTEGGDPGDPNDVVSAADLNALKTVVGENRDQANAALAATAGAVVDQTASFSLASTDHGKVVRVDSAGGALVITIPHTLFGSIIASGVFRTTILVTNADEAITIAGSGGIVPQYFGRKTIRIGDLITITVTWRLSPWSMCAIGATRSRHTSGRIPRRPAHSPWATRRRSSVSTRRATRWR